MNKQQQVMRLLNAYDFTISDVAQVAQERDLSQYQVCAKFLMLAKYDDTPMPELVAALLDKGKLSIADVVILLNATNRGLDYLISRQISQAVSGLMASMSLKKLCSLAYDQNNLEPIERHFNDKRSDLMQTHRNRILRRITQGPHSHVSLKEALMKERYLYCRAAQLLVSRHERLYQLRNDFRSLWSQCVWKL